VFTELDRPAGKIDAWERVSERRHVLDEHPSSLDDGRDVANGVIEVVS
jgi:hypothetical protein